MTSNKFETTKAISLDEKLAYQIYLVNAIIKLALLKQLPYNLYKQYSQLTHQLKLNCLTTTFNDEELDEELNLNIIIFLIR